MWIRTMVKYMDSFMFVVVVLIIFGSIFGPIAYQQSLTPPHSLFPFAGGFFPDFYQYLSWIKDGYDGYFLLTSRYTEVVNPRVLIHPLFPIIGIIGAITHLQPYVAYFVSRIVATVLFIVVYFMVVRKIIGSPFVRSLALLCLLSATGFWTLVKSTSGTILSEQIPWSTNFNVLYKFNLPPHHFLSLSAFLIIIYILHIRTYPHSRTSYVLLVLLNGAMGVFNPSQLTLAFIIYFCALSISFVPFFKQVKQIRTSLIVLTVSALPILIYHVFLFLSIQPWSIMYELMKRFNPDTTLLQYVFALGPLFFISLFALTISTLQKPVFFLIVLWAYIPIALFILRGFGLPLNTSRIFQSYQFIPLSILAAVGLYTIHTALFRWKKWTVVFSSFAIGALLLYGVLPFQKTLKNYATSLSPRWFNVYIPNSLLHTLTFLDTQTPRESVVLASEFVSQMIPAFSHNRTFIARDDIAWNYSEKINLAVVFLNGTMEPNVARKFLQTYRISYILYGIDAPLFSQIPPLYRALVHEEYTNGSITIARVIL